MNLRKLQIIWVVGVTLFLLPAFGPSAFGQRLAATVSATPVEPGEELIYKAEISRSLLRKLDVATFRFSATREPVPERTNGAAVNAAPYQLKYIGDVASEGLFVTLFKVHFRQHIESTVDPESLAAQKTVRLDEQGKRVRSSEAIFDRKAGKIIWTERNPNDPTRPERTQTSDLRGPVQDVVSAIYYIRGQQLEVGKRFEVPISDSGKVYFVPVMVADKQRRKTVLGRVPVVRVIADLFGEHGLVNAKGHFELWLTDDNRHIPVAAQVKTEYGTFDITLKKVSNQTTRSATSHHAEARPLLQLSE